MKKLLLIIFLTLFVLFIDLYGKLLVSHYFPGDSETSQKNITSKQDSIIENTSSGSVSTMLGRDPESLLAAFGEPDRVEPSAYDYEWWVYNSDLSKYVQFGIFQNKIVSIYAAGQQVDVSPFQMGESYQDLYAQAPFSYEISLEYNNSSYEFELSESEVNEQPLIAVENGWAQLYFDKFTQELSGIRYMDNETLLKQRPYQLMYSGALIDAQELTAEQQEKVEAANAKQIFDLTNIIRLRHSLKVLTVDEATAKVAYLHSKDMKEDNYFDHESPQYGSLSDRLERGDVSFQAAGENIASHYPDGIAAVQGWLNSEGHRKNLLNAQFNSLGVGVYDSYYTQNFTKK